MQGAAAAPLPAAHHHPAVLQPQHVHAVPAAAASFVRDDTASERSAVGDKFSEQDLIRLVSPASVSPPTGEQYASLLASCKVVARHRNATLITMLLAARTQALQQIVHLHSLPQPLHAWMHHSVDGYIHGLLTYTQESISLVDTFDPAASLAPAAPLLPGMPCLRVHAFLSTASYRNSTLLTLAVRGHEALSATYAAVVNAMRADVAAQHTLSIRAAVRTVHGVALAVSTYLRRTSEVVKRFVSASEQCPLLSPEHTTRTLHIITQLGLEALDPAAN